MLPTAPSPTLRLWRFAFAAALLIVLTLSLLPGTPESLTTGWDKTNHLLGFALLGLLGCYSVPQRVLWVMLALLGYGALIEGLQSLTPYRQAEWGDWLADALGLLLGWVLFRLLARRRIG